MRYELRFDDLFTQGHGYVFPCDEHGVVDLDAISQNAKARYLYVHTLIGHDFSAPRVVKCIEPEAPRIERMHAAMRAWS